MVKYSIDTEQLKVAIRKLESIEGKYGTASNKVNQSYRQIVNLSGGNISQAKKNIVSAGNIYDRQMENVTNIKNCLRNISNETVNMDLQAKREFESDEYDSKKAKLSEVGDWKTLKEQQAKAVKDVSKTAVKIVSKLLGKAAYEGSYSYAIGPAVSLVGGRILDAATETKNDEVDDFLDGGKTLASVVKSAGKSHQKSLVKLLEKGKITKATSELGTSFGKKLELGGKIAGWAFDVLESARSNYDEFNGNYKNKRFITETVVEAGLAIGTTALVGAIAGTTAPLWAVPAGLLVLNSTLDVGSKLITGNDLGWKENVSNAIADKVESLISSNKESYCIGSVKKSTYCVKEV